MAFYTPPFQQHRNFVPPKWLILVLGFLLILLSMFMISTLDNTPKEHPALNTTVATVSKERGYPRKMSGRISLAGPSSPYLAASVKTTPLEESLVALLQDAGRADAKTGRYSEIPEGTKLRKVSVQGNTVIVDLSSEFATGGGSTSMIQRVEELKRVIHKFNKNYHLKIAVNGRVLKYLGGEGLELE